MYPPPEHRGVADCRKAPTFLDAGAANLEQQPCVPVLKLFRASPGTVQGYTARNDASGQTGWTAGLAAAAASPTVVTRFGRFRRTSFGGSLSRERHATPRLILLIARVKKDCSSLVTIQASLGRCKSHKTDLPRRSVPATSHLRHELHLKWSAKRPFEETTSHLIESSKNRAY